MEIIEGEANQEDHWRDGKDEHGTWITCYGKDDDGDDDDDNDDEVIIIK